MTWWCSGFSPGLVWYIYEYTGDESVLALARKSTAKLDSLVYNPKTDHDIGFLLKHSVGNLRRNSEVDVPLTYADYYFLEALLRYKNKK